MITDEMVEKALAAYEARVNDYTIRLMRSALAAALASQPSPQVGEWQPIDTAPKDGTMIDLWGTSNGTIDKGGMRAANVSWGPIRDWMGRERDDWQHGCTDDFNPTHWMPLPSPPASPKQETSNDE